MSKLSILVALILSCVSLTSCSGGPPFDGRREDAVCADLLQRKTHAEALPWLEQSKDGDIRTIGEQDPATSLAIAKELHQAGAVKVHALDIERDPNLGETTNTLIVELPEGLEQRRKLFAIEARTAKSAGFDPVPDQGQHYMFLHGFKLTLSQAVRTAFAHKQKSGTSR